MRLTVSLVTIWMNVLLSSEWIAGVLSYRAFLIKDTFIVGEPVVVRLLLINNSKENVYIEQYPETKRVPFGVKIFTEDGREIEDFHQFVDRVYFGVTHLKPRDTVCYLWSHILCYRKKAKSGGYLLPGEKDVHFLSKGRYILKYSLPGSPIKISSSPLPLGEVKYSRLWHRTVYADSLVIFVKTPEKDEDRKALKEWEKAAFVMYYDPTRAPKKDIRIYENIVRKYPNSVYAPYALYFLAENYRVRGRFKKAITLFRKLKTDYPEFPLNSLYEYNLACCYAGRGWMSVANSLLDRYLRKFPKDIRNQGALTDYIRKRHKKRYVFSWY